MKLCITCNTEKELNEFYKRKDVASGYRANCKVCYNEKKQALGNTEKQINKKRRYAIKYRMKYDSIVYQKEYQKEYRNKNKK